MRWQHHGDALRGHLDPVTAGIEDVGRNVAQNRVRVTPVHIMR